MEASVSLVGFMDDVIFRKDLSLVLDHNDDQGIGYLNSIWIDYFATIGELYDKRSTRLNVINVENVGTPAIGQSKIVFDNKQITDTTLWNTITQDQKDTIFNIAELLYLSQNSTLELLEHMLLTDSVYKSLYVQNSISISSTLNSVYIYSPLYQQINVPNWIEFFIYLSDDKSKTLRVKLWLSSNDFSKNYPYTTITQVIPPCPPERLFATTKNLSQMDTMIEASQYTFSLVNTDLVNNDQSGAVIFKTKYYLSEDTQYQISFAILYKGAKTPSTMACRGAIREFLIATGLTSIDILEIMFPELFVEYQFYIVPLWDYKTVLEDRTVYPSIGPVFTYSKGIINTLYDNLDTDFIESRIETILNAKLDIFSLVVPSPLNPDTSTLMSMHPTYCRRATTEEAYQYMTDTTKVLANKLAKTMAVFTNDVATNEFNTYVEDERTYLTFTVGTAEILVLSPDGYHYTKEV